MQEMKTERYPFDEFLEHLGHLVATVRHYESVDIPTMHGSEHLELPTWLKQSPEGLFLQIRDYMGQINEDPVTRDYKTGKLRDLLGHLVLHWREYNQAGVIKASEGKLEAPEYVWQIFHMTLCSEEANTAVTPQVNMELIEELRKGISTRE